MRKWWYSEGRVLRGVLPASLILALVPMAVAQPAKTNSPNANPPAGTNAGSAGNLMSKSLGNGRTGANPVLTREEPDQVGALKKRAEQGNARAQFNLALCYYWGNGVAQDYAEAAVWYRKAAEQGNAEAQYHLGICFTEGQGVERDPAEAVKWYRKAAEQGNASAQYNLGVCYTEGTGVEKDYTEGVKWWRRAADQDDPQAQCNLAICYYLGQGMTKDCAEAVKWFRRAAEQGNAYAQISLAVCYEDGNGVNQDLAQAAAWYRRAAEQGNALAQYNLGVCCAEGQGVNRNFDEAVKWYRRAAAQGNASAQISLAFCYEDGISVPKDNIEAYKWFNLAAAHGGADRSRWRDLLAAEMSKEEIAEARKRTASFVGREELPPRRAPSSGPGASGPRPTGTGFFVTEDGYFATSFHVVDGAARVAVKTDKGVLPARLVNADKVNDVAILKVEGKFVAVPVVTSRGTKIGEAVFAVGFPDPAQPGPGPKATWAEIRSLTGAQNDPREFQLDAAVQAGNSGGPLVNRYGNVVGVVGARPAESAGPKTPAAAPREVNYAVKSSLLSVLLESLPETSPKLKEPYSSKERKLEDVVRDAQSATAMVSLVY